jgi:hypothetical protein
MGGDAPRYTKVRVAADGVDGLFWHEWRQTEPPFESRTYSGEDIKGMLMEFARLANADVEVFLEFGNRWGLLGLCDEHGLPFTHPGNEHCNLKMREPIRHWRRLARQISSILRIAMDLHWSDQNPGSPPRLGSPQDWVTIDEEADPEILMPGDLDAAKEWLAVYVGNFVEWTQPTPQFYWHDGDARIEFAGWTTFAYIAVQLIFFVASAREAALCGECGQLYLPRRKPRVDQNNYCDDCRARGAPDRDSKRRQRAGIATPRSLQKRHEGIDNGLYLHPGHGPRDSQDVLWG